MQEPCESVPKIEPLQEPDLDQGEVHQAVEIPLLWIETGVEPDSPAALNALVDERHPVIEPAELRNPHVTICLERLGHARRVDGVHRGNARHLAVDERGEFSVVGNLVPVRLVKHMLEVEGLPPAFLEMGAE